MGGCFHEHNRSGGRLSRIWIVRYVRAKNFFSRRIPARRASWFESGSVDYFVLLPVMDPFFRATSDGVAVKELGSRFADFVRERLFGPPRQGLERPDFSIPVMGSRPAGGFGEAHHCGTDRPRNPRSLCVLSVFAKLFHSG